MSVETVLGFFSSWIVYLGMLVLHLVLPARRVTGYVRDEHSGELLTYRLNGLLVLLASIAIFYSLGRAELVPYDWLYVHRWESLLGAVTLGLLFTFAVVLPAPPTGKSFLADLYLGRYENPQWLGRRVDAKMYLYLVGAVLLELNLLSFTAHHLNRYPADPSPGVFLYLGLFSWFVLDYLYFERVHLYTYDLFAERVGFKLGWGCMAFYPYFYTVGLWYASDRPNPGSSSLWLVGSAIVFFTGWSLSRGANMQKFYFKLDPTRSFLRIRPETVSDGERTLLVNGFWGVSRHVNYLGEVLMATGLALSLGYPGALWPWLYPIYYVALLFPRERDDDERCAAKYGALWDEYRKRVPRRIIPGVY